jgi:hypothetical protein
MIVLLFTGVAPQQGQSNADGAYIGKIPQIKSLLGTVPQAKNFSVHRLQVHRVSPDELQTKNTCYTVRSYHFQRQDGQAPMLTGVSTCTPANKLQQRRVSRTPETLYTPLGLLIVGQK